MKINHFHSNFSYLNLMCRLENIFYPLINYFIHLLPIIYHYIEEMKKLDSRVYLYLSDIILHLKHLEI